MTASNLAFAFSDTAVPPIACETWADAADVDALIDRAFGPGRFVKAAERLREGHNPIWPLSFVAREEGRLVGCVRQWSILIGCAPAIFLGPIAVEADHRGRGLGAALVKRACEAAGAAGHGAILLVGDRSFFMPLGFEALVAGRIVMPGPVDPARVMIHPLRPGGAEGLSGQVSPA